MAETAQNRPNITYSGTSGASGGMAVQAGGSLQSNWANWGSLKRTADGLPATVFAAGVGTWEEVPPGVTYGLLLAQAAAAVTGGATVEIYGKDANGVITPLLSVTGNQQITFGTTTIQVDTAVYVVAESSVGDHLFDLRGSKYWGWRLVTPGACSAAFDLLFRHL